MHLFKIIRFICTRFFLGIFFLHSAMGGEAISNDSKFYLDEDNSKREKRVLELISIAEKQASWRMDILKLYNKMSTFSEENNGKILARDLDHLRSSIKRFTHHISKPLNLLKSKSLADIDFLNPDHIVLLETKEPSQIDKNFSRIARANDLRDRRGRRVYRKIVTRISINPFDQLGVELLEELTFQVVQRLVTLDNISIGLIPFMKNSELRMTLIHDLENDESRTVEASWHDYMNTLYKSNNLGKLYKIISTYKTYIKKQNQLNLTLFKLLDESLVGSYIKRKTDSFTFFTDMFKQMGFMAKRRWDIYTKIGVKSIYEASKIFGNTVGLVQSRHGYLYDMSKEEEEKLAARLRPLDVLFEKTPFRLTDRFIPGYFGHNAIWTGTEEELKELGVWDALPEIYMNAVEKFGYAGPSFQQDIRNGVRIIEALRPGVQINTLRHFLDIDDFAAMRARECESMNKERGFCLTPELKKEYLLMAFSQIGKDYDFAFDVNTEETIVCSELLYRTFLDIDFETRLTVGSFNISPDQVAYQGDEEGDIFTPFIIIHNGEEVTEDLQGFFYDLLH
ncbi:MAG: hypothetical protein CME63_09090 [Halobacteriovoraceae bacterium]|nr:hypothetical protein [Halobacteriovoraceae bacterium]